MFRTKLNGFYKNLCKKTLIMSAIAIMLCSPTMNAQKRGDVFNVNNLYYKINSDTENTVEVIDNHNPNGYYGDIVIPENVQFQGKSYLVNAIEPCAFSKDKYLMTVEIPGTIKVIPSEAFSLCMNLYSIKLGEGIKEIDDEAFYGNYALTSIELPSTLVKIGHKVFDRSLELEQIKFPENIEIIGSIGECPWSDNLPLGEVYIGKVFYKYNEDPAIDSTYTVNIKEGTTCIAKEAFYDNKHIVSLKIPQSMKHIGDNACFVATYLDTIEFENPNNLEYIGGEAFASTSWDGKQPMGDIYIGNNYYVYKNDSNNPMPENTTIKIKDGTKAISPLAFEGQDNLVAVEIPKSVKNIGKRAFGNCTNLKVITFPDSVKELNSNMFIGCTNLTTVNLPNHIEAIKQRTFDFSGIQALTIPSQCKFINPDNFYVCPNLESFTISADNPYFTTVDGVLFSKDKKTLIAFPKGKNIDYTIPEGTETIMSKAFNVSHLKSITTPTTLKNIEESAFEESTLVSADLSKSNKLQVIGNNAFKDCMSLKKVILPDTVNKMEDRVFNGCDVLADVTFPKKIESVGSRLFTYTAWLEAQPEGVVYINDIAIDYVDKGSKEMTIKEGTKSIAKDFSSFNNSIETIKLPASLTRIDDSSFTRLQNLTQIIGGENTILYGNVFADSKMFKECKDDPVYWNNNFMYSHGEFPENSELIIPEGTKSCNLNNNTGNYQVKYENVTSIEFPKSIEVITANKRWFWTGVKTFKIKNPVPPTVIGAFEVPTLLNTMVYVNKSSVEAYKSTFPWCLFKNIVADPAGVEGVETDQSIRVFANGNNIIVEGASDNSSIKVFNLNGQTIYNGAETRISVPTSGLFIVNVDGKAFKVVL